MKKRSLEQPVAPIEAPAKSARFSELITFLTADWGNRFLKQMLTGQRPSVTVMENAVTVLKQSAWEKECERSKYSPARYANTQLFGYLSRDPDKAKREWIYVAVGDRARSFGRPKELTEEIKYDYNLYWGAIVVANLLAMFPPDQYPNGNEYVVLALAHPTKSIGQRGAMVQATGGRHYVKLPNGKEVKFFVREILPWDEPVGGIVCWTETLEAQYNALDLRPGHTILVVDIGGGVTSFTRVTVERDDVGKLQFQPIYNLELSPSFSMGIHNVLERLYNNLSTDNDAFTGMKDNLDRLMLEEGLRYGEIELSGGTPVDVTTERALAEFELLDRIKSYYINSLGGGRPFKAIVTTGGGMHIYHDRLVDELFKHKNIYRANEAHIHLANLYGGDEIFRQWIARERKVK